MATEYFHLGVVQSAASGTVQPFGTVSLGATVFKPDGAWGNEWFFSAIFGAGAKIYATESVGFRLQGRLLAPMRWGGGGLWCGPAGCTVGAASYTTLVQVDISAGVMIILGD